MNYKISKTIVDDLGRITIPNEMLKSLGVVDGDVLDLIVTDNVIVIEREEKQND